MQIKHSWMLKQDQPSITLKILCSLSRSRATTNCHKFMKKSDITRSAIEKKNMLSDFVGRF